MNVQVLRALDLLGPCTLPDWPAGVITRAFPIEGVRETVACTLEKRAHATVLLDFTGIQSVTLSVAEGWGPLLQQRFLQARPEGAFFAYQNCAPKVAEVLQLAFSGASRRCPFPEASVAFLPDGHPVFLGRIPAHLLEVLEVLYQQGGCTSRSLASQGIRAPSKKLFDLHTHFGWLLRKVHCEEPDQAWCHLHLPIYPSGESHRGILRNTFPG